MTDEARAIAHLKCAVEIIDRINGRVDPKAEAGLPKLIVGRAACCSKQAKQLVERFEEEFVQVSKISG